MTAGRFVKASGQCFTTASFAMNNKICVNFFFLRCGCSSQLEWNVCLVSSTCEWPCMAYFCVIYWHHLVFYAQLSLRFYSLTSQKIKLKRNEMQNSKETCHRKKNNNKTNEWSPKSIAMLSFFQVSFAYHQVKCIYMLMYSTFHPVNSTLDTILSKFFVFYFCSFVLQMHLYVFILIPFLC